MTAPPTVSVVMTTYNRRAGLADALEPVLADPETLEVVVVVDGCRDGSLELLTDIARQHPKLRPLMPARNLGQPRARLFGVEHARGEVVLSLDDDVVAAAGLVGAHRHRHANHPHAVVLGYMPTAIPSRRRAGQYATFEYARAYEEHCERYERDPATVLTHLWGGNFSVRRADFLAAVEGCDFPLRYHEDRDLGLRFRRLGLQPVFDRSLRATHRHERSFPSYLRDARSAGGGAMMLSALHPQALERFSADDAIPHYSRPAQVVVRWSDDRRLRRLSIAALHGGVVVAGRLRMFALEEKLAVVAKHIAEREGAREVELHALASRVRIPDAGKARG